MKISDAEDYPIENMSLVYSSKTKDVYQAIFQTEKYGIFTRIDGRWRALSPEDRSLDNLSIIDILPEDYKEVTALFDAAQKANRYLKYDEVKEFEVGYTFDGSAEALLRDESDDYPLSKGFHAFQGCDYTLLKSEGTRNVRGDLLLSITYKLISTRDAAEIYNNRQFYQISEETYVYLETGYCEFHGHEIDKEMAKEQNLEGLVIQGNLDDILERFTLWLVEVDPIGFELLRRMNRDGFTDELAITEDLTGYHDSEEPMDRWLNEMTDYADSMELNIELDTDNRSFMLTIGSQVSSANSHTKSDFFESGLREDWVHPSDRIDFDLDDLENDEDDDDEIEDLTDEEIEQLRIEAVARKKESEKISFSDIPPSLQKLIRELIQRVEDKIGEEDAEVCSADLKGFIAGEYMRTQSEISSQMAKHLRMLV
jgi:hypothetical protein